MKTAIEFLQDNIPSPTYKPNYSEIAILMEKYAEYYSNSHKLSFSDDSFNGITDECIKVNDDRYRSKSGWDKKSIKKVIKGRIIYYAPKDDLA